MTKNQYGLTMVWALGLHLALTWFCHGNHYMSSGNAEGTSFLIALFYTTWALKGREKGLGDPGHLQPSRTSGDLRPHIPMATMRTPCGERRKKPWQPKGKSPTEPDVMSSALHQSSATPAQAKNMAPRLQAAKNCPTPEPSPSHNTQGSRPTTTPKYPGLSAS